MDTNKAAYWIALAVLALGLNSEYHKGNFVALHRVADRASATLCQLSTRGEHLLALAKLSLQQKDRDNDIEVASNDVEAAAASVESARAQAESLRESARARADAIREQALAQGEAIRDQVRAQVKQLRAQGEMRRAMSEQVRVRGRYLNLVSTGNHDMAAHGVTAHRVTVNGMTVVCPKTGTRVVVSDDSDLSDDAKVEVDDAF
jgi:hypothetical protein